MNTTESSPVSVRELLVKAGISQLIVLFRGSDYRMSVMLEAHHAPTCGGLIFVVGTVPGESP